MSSPLASPRSSTSSTDIYTSEPPLTPMSDLGLEKATERLVLADADAEEDGLETIPESAVSVGKGTPGAESGLPVPPKQAYRTRPDARSEAQSQFAGFSFGRPPSLEPPITTTPSAIPVPSSSAPPRSPRTDQDPSPSTSFSFGSCPSVPLLSTPTAELGAFEYPEYEPGHPLHPSSALESAHMRGSTSSSSSTSSTSSSYSRASTSSGHRGSIPLGLALGQSHRRNSIISRPALHPSNSSSSSTYTATGYPSPPQTRRSSTTSTITTLPAAGRRPSIIHSATTEAALPLPSISSIYPGPPDLDSPHPPPSPYANTARRSSILFHPKHLHQPVPPSLLARRGSLPAASLASASGLGFSPHRASNTRSSVSIPVGGYGGPGQITSHRLYNRRESVLSVGSSTGSGSTVRMEGGEITRRSSLRENGRKGGNGQAEAGAEGQAASSSEGRSSGTSGGLARRSSMPIHHALSASTRQEEADRAGQQPQPTHTQPPYSPASPRSGSSARTHPPASYGSPVRRSRGSIPNAPASPAELAYDPPAVGSRWTPRPSMSGRSLSSSEESDESGEGAPAERVAGAAGEGTVFSDPWGSGRDTGSAEDDEAERAESRRRGSRLVDVGRPGLETVNSDLTERG